MTDQRMDAIMAKLLRASVIPTAALVLAGGGAYVASNGRTVPDYRQFDAQTARAKESAVAASADRDRTTGPDSNPGSASSILLSCFC